jgi:hypothetical protein
LSFVPPNQSTVLVKNAENTVPFRCGKPFRLRNNQTQIIRLLHRETKEKT